MRFDQANQIPGMESSAFFLESGEEFFSRFNQERYTVFPGFCDVHVHFREPGFSYKETIRSGSMAAAAGGYTAVCAMPNLNPVPDTAEHLQQEQDIIDRDAVIHVYPYAAITMEQKGAELARLEDLASGAVAFSDDGHGVQSDDLMREAMIRARALGKMIVAHCEDNSLLRGGCIHKGSFAAANGLPGICSESEWRQVERDLSLVEETGCSYHVCHISTRESVELIRQAKARGLDVSCETAPHYLLLDENSLRDEGRFKMNPPIRSREDRDALIRGLLDGTIDCIATDHAPHSPEEKAGGLAGSSFGIVGLETAFPVLYTGLVCTGILSLEQLVRLLTDQPRTRFSLPLGNDFSLWDLSKEYTIDPECFLSMGKATPFAGWKVRGKCVLTVCGGRVVYQANKEG